MRRGSCLGPSRESERRSRAPIGEAKTVSNAVIHLSVDRPLKRICNVNNSFASPKGAIGFILCGMKTRSQSCLIAQGCTRFSHDICVTSAQKTIAQCLICNDIETRGHFANFSGSTGMSDSRPLVSSDRTGSLSTW
jgi:hypothetical protein